MKGGGGIPVGELRSVYIVAALILVVYCLEMNRQFLYNSFFSFVFLFFFFACLFLYFSPLFSDCFCRLDSRAREDANKLFQSAGNIDPGDGRREADRAREKGAER